MSYPYLAKTILKYKSPHATDLSFAKDETIRVTGPSDDDEDWLVGETLDGSKAGGFPKDFITRIENSASADETLLSGGSNDAQQAAESAKAAEIDKPASSVASTDAPPPVPASAPAPPSPKLEPAALPPSSVSSPAPAPAPAEAPPSAPSTTAAATPNPKAQAGGAVGDSPPRPQSMKDRLAFFGAAQTKAAPPPIKPKPAAGGLTWSQRQKLRQEQEAKEREESGQTAPQPPSAPASRSAPGPDQSKPIPEEKESEKGERAGSAMSAADALSSISKGGSLKARMAALQGHGAFGGDSTASEKPAAPAPSGKVWKRPPAPPAPEPEPEADPESELSSAPQAQSVRSPAAEEGDALAQAGAEGEESEAPGEEDEEEKEKARRAAIAARMAKLGARGPMGMMPPAKPARKPTREAEVASATPAQGGTEPAKAPEAIVHDEGKPQEATADRSQLDVEPTEPAESKAEPAALPKSIPIPAMPRRTAPPRRRGAAPVTTTSAPEAPPSDPTESENRFEQTNDDGAPIPPPQVMVAGEEDPLPKSKEAKAKMAEDEQRGAGVGGLEGAAAAGIALAPIEASARQEDDAAERSESDADDDKVQPPVGAVGSAASDARGTGAILTKGGEGDIVTSSEPLQEVEEGILEGGDEKDDIMVEAEKGNLAIDDSPPLDESAESPLSPDPIGMVPLHPPASDGSDYDEDEPPPPPPRRMSLDMPLDELELKHEHDHAHSIQRSQHPVVQEEVEEEQDDEEDVPAPPPRRISTDRPLGPRPLPSPGKNTLPALAGRLPPPPLGNPLVPPRNDEEDEEDGADDIAEEGESDEEDNEAEAPPLPPSRHVPPVAVLTAEDEAPPPPTRTAHQPDTVPAPSGDDRDDDDAPPPPARRSIPPAPREVKVEEDTPAPPTPTRKPPLPAPLQIGIPAAGTTSKSPTSPKASLSSPTVSTSPTRSRTLTEQPVSSQAEDEDASRRSGIAARMAKLGGIKFGMPPPTFRKQSQNVTSPTSGPGEPLPSSGTNPEEPASPIDQEPPVSSPIGEKPEQQILSPAPGPAQERDDETPEQEAARRRATLARLRAGGALGFGIFNHASSAEEPKEDARGIQEDTEEGLQAPAPPPPSGPSVPSSRPVPPAPADEGDDEALAPPPPTRPIISTAVASEEGAPAPPARMPQSPAQAPPASPGHLVRSPSGRRPPVPLEKRFSQSHKRTTSTTSSPTIHEDRPESGDWQIANEPAVIMANQVEVDEPQENDDLPPPPPPARPPPPPMQTEETAPRRSASIASRGSRRSLDVNIPPATPTRSPSNLQHQTSYSPAAPPPVQPSPARQPSTSRGSGGRPGFEQLKEASATHGSQIIRAAQALFSQGRKAYFGDGSPAGFVLVAMDHAHVPRPEQGWGQIIFEQEGGSILRRYDEPRPGDIAAFYDTKLKGKKGLTTYNQHVGSVEEPLVGVVAEFEDRKHKLRVLQVERGTPEEVSYRCEDLKSGKIMVYRPGM